MPLNIQVRLNERNVVELINKLNQLGFLGDGLLHTVNGREYVTPEHLRKELMESVEQAGGRMSLVRANGPIPDDYSQHALLTRLHFTSWPVNQGKT